MLRAASTDMTDLFPILHEDDDLLVINKPAGLVCHPTKGDERSSLVGRLRLYLGPQGGAHLINRLDRETSGIIVAAKTPESSRTLRQAWAARTVHKEYRAVVQGWPGNDSGEIDLPLGKDEASRIAIKDCIRADGAEARTCFCVLQRFERAEGRFALLHVEPYTGRKHQIRIHLSHLGHPLVGDKLYGPDELLYLAFVKERLTEADRARLILPHQALHAGVVEVPWNGETKRFEAPPEAWFTSFVRGEFVAPWQ